MLADDSRDITYRSSRQASERQRWVLRHTRTDSRGRIYWQRRYEGWRRLRDHHEFNEAATNELAGKAG
jgi:hypothetical protein